MRLSIILPAKNEARADVRQCQRRNVPAKPGLDMRVILLLLVVAILGAIAVQQLSSVPSARVALPDGEVGTPSVPTRPGEVQSFGQDLDRFVEDAARQRAREIDRATE